MIKKTARLTRKYGTENGCLDGVFAPSTPNRASIIIFTAVNHLYIIIRQHWTWKGHEECLQGLSAFYDGESKWANHNDGPAMMLRDMVGNHSTVTFCHACP